MTKVKIPAGSTAARLSVLSLSLTALACSGAPAPACESCDAATLDGNVSADAAIRDAATHDAAMPDAAMLDAALPDAALADAGLDAAVAAPTWHVEMVAEDVGVSDLVPSLALDADAQAIGWFDGGRRRGLLAVRGASAWATQTVEDIEFSGYCMNVAFDSSGHLRVLFHRQPGDNLVFGTRDDAGVLHLSTVFSTRAQGWLARAALVDDVFHSVSLTDDAPNGIAHVFGDGVTWTEELAYARPAGYPTGSYAIAVHGDRVYALLVREHPIGAESSDLLLAERAPDGTWSTDLVHERVGASPGLVGLAIDAAGNPHVCMDTWDEELLYAERVLGVWQTEPISPSTGLIDQFCSIAFDDAGRLHLAHAARSGVRYAVREAGVWSPDVVIDPTTGTTTPLDLRIDDDGLPHVAYAIAHTVTADLRHAWLGDAR